MVDVHMRRLIALPIILVVVVLLSGKDLRPQGGTASGATQVGDESDRCAALLNPGLIDIPDAPTRILSARLVDVPAGSLEGPRGAGPIQTTIKQYCQVTGYVGSQNKFELRLPLASDWNQKFYFYACGGFCGIVNGTLCNPALARGYATVTTNGGHDSAPGFDGVWAANSTRLQEDFAWRDTHVTTIAAKAIIVRHFGRPIVHAYISGCSKGGQAVLKQAQRFPEDYDGYLPVAPVYDYTGRSVEAAAWFAQAVHDGAGGSVLDQRAADIVHRSVLARCGAQAGVDEGLVTDPIGCDWHPELIACGSGSVESGCLTAKQVSAVQRLMRPAVDSKGKVIYAYPYVPGTETEWGTWNYGTFSNFRVADQFLRYLADTTPRQNVDPFRFNFDRDPTSLARARSLYDATSTDLRAVKARGGKIVMWHGLADAGIVASSSIAYHESVTKAMGGRPQVEEFFRLFLIPGVHHCGGGPGLTDFDALTLLENWVERGKAPDVLIARRSTNGVIERARPVYPYPIRARYASGDPTLATSFVPVDAGRD
jgi:Tannase and feruloyl esterase